MTDRLRRGPGLRMVGLLAAVGVIPALYNSVPLTTWRDPPVWLMVITLAVLLSLGWGSLLTLVEGLRGDYNAEGRFLVGLTGADAPWSLRRARWPSFSLGLALFVAANKALGSPTGAAEFAVRVSLTALLAGAVASWGSPRGLWIDGGTLRFDRWLTQRSVRLDSLARVATPPGGDRLSLRLQDGRAIEVPLAGVDSALRRALVGAVAAASGAGLAEPAEPPPEGADARWAVLDREGRDLRAWRAALRTLALADEGFRAAPVSRDDLLRLLADPRTPGERRLAAALALWETRAMAPGTAEHIRAAATRATDPRVRAALLDVPEERLDERAIERASAAGREAALTDLPG